MEELPKAGAAVCAKCRSPLTAEGRCLPCLLRGGLLSEEETLTVSPPAVTAPISPPSVGPESPVRYGDFEITRREDGNLWELGQGAMGVTYRAVDRVLHRAVALKVIQFATSGGANGGGATLDGKVGEALRARFLREARAAASLRHPNIAGVFQFGVSHGSGRCFYAMELVEGETLEARVRRDGPLPAPLALEVAAQVARALVAAESRGLIHRDLKPSNLMVAAGESGDTKPVVVKVIDFGLAKAVAAAATAKSEKDLTHGGFVGTPAFASPEQLERGGQPLDARTDIYSLGVTLWYALTGRVPFTGRTLDELRYHPARTTLPMEQLQARRVPAPLIALLRAMLAEDPAERPASARDLLAVLESCRRPSPARNVEPSSPGEERNPAPRVWLAAAVSIAAIATLTAGGAAWWVRSRPATNDRAGGAAPLVATDKSVAVLPFDNRSADPADAFFADGVQDEILTNLAKVADLKVTSRTSVLAYKGGGTTPRKLREITRELGVAHVVEGSVQRSGNRIRITAQLIDGRTDAHLWAQTYDRELADVFDLQSKIARTIADQLAAKLSPRERAAIDTPPTSNLAAYQAYLAGKNVFRDWAGTGSKEEVQRLEEATTRDPQFFLAWCELSRAHMRLYWFDLDHTPERRARAESALQRARSLRPDDGEVHLASGLIRYWGYRDYPAAIAELQAAARLLPNDPRACSWLGWVLRRQGQWAECIPYFERAVALDPRNAVGWTALADVEGARSRYAEATRAIDQALTLDPGNLDYLESKAWLAFDERADLAPLHAWLRSLPPDSDTWRDDAAGVSTLLALYERDYPAAARAFARFDSPYWINGGYLWPRETFAGQIASLDPDRAAATAELLTARQRAEESFRKRPDDAKALMVLATLDAHLGRREDAVREGEQAVAMQRRVVDAYASSIVSQLMAAVYARSGARDQAVETLRSMVGQPLAPTYGNLGLDPAWDGLRGDPRFEAMVASVAPKPAR